MSAPSSFQLTPAAEDLHLPPSPPKRLKPEIYQNPDVFKNVDDHAIAVSLRLCFMSPMKVRLEVKLARTEVSITGWICGFTVKKNRDRNVKLRELWWLEAVSLITRKVNLNGLDMLNVKMTC